MKSRRWHHPDATQDLLLRAAFGDDAEAPAAWHAWRQQRVQPDAGSRRLLPQVYRHLRAMVTDPTLHALAGTYRQTFVRNTVRARGLATVIAELAESEIPALVLKGGALAHVAYADWGARPMADFDLLVHRASAGAALRLLTARGFAPSSAIPEAFLDHHHGAELVDPSGQRLDLHWRLMHECHAGSAEHAFWDQARPLPLEALTAATLCPTDHLFHVLVHGARSSPVQPIGWAADALALLMRRSAEIDWDRLLTLVSEHGVAVPVASALGWLGSRQRPLVPEAAVVAAQALPAPAWQRIEHAVKVRPRRLVGTAPVLLFDHHRLTLADAKAPSLRRYLQSTFRLETAWALPAAMAQQAGRRIGTSLRVVPSESAVEPTTAALLKGVLRVLSGEGLVLVSGVVTAAILARSLGVAGYGLFGVAATVVYWVEMSVPMLYARAILGRSSPRDADFDAGVQWAYFGTGLVFTGAIVFAAPLAGRWLGEPAMAGYLTLFALDVPLAAIAAGQRVLLFADAGYARIALLTSVRAAGRLLFVAVALSMQADIATAILASIAATIVELAAGFAMLGGRWLRRPRWPRLDVGGSVVPLALSSLSLRLFRRLDVVLVQALGRSAELTGLYGAAQNVTAAMTGLNNALPPALLSSLARLGPDAHQARRDVATSSVRLLLLPLPGLAFCAMSASTIAALVYGDGFRAAGPVMAVLALASYAEVVGAVVGAPLIAAGRASRILAATALLVPLAAIGHLWAIPRAGSDGAAAVTFVLSAAAAASVAVSAFRLRLIGFPIRSAAIGFAVSGSAAAAARVLALEDWTVAPWAIAVGLIGAGVLLATGAVPLADVIGLRALRPSPTSEARPAR